MSAAAIEQPETFGVIAGSDADPDRPFDGGAAPAMKYLCTSVARASDAAPALKYICTSVAMAAAAAPAETFGVIAGSDADPDHPFNGGATPAMKYLCTSVARASDAAPALKYICTSVARSAAAAGPAETFGVIAGSDADPDQASLT
jgi:hypothetical protein